MNIFCEVEDGAVLSRQMPSTGKVQRSEAVPGTFVFPSELRNGKASVPVKFYAKGRSVAEVRKVRKWILKRIGGQNSLEFHLTPAVGGERVTICKMLVEPVEDRNSVRIKFEGPRDINPKGHVHHQLPPRRTRLAFADAERMSA